MLGYIIIFLVKIICIFVAFVIGSSAFKKDFDFAKEYRLSEFEQAPMYLLVAGMVLMALGGIFKILDKIGAYIG
jgi:hypothetical protein